MKIPVSARKNQVLATFKSKFNDLNEKYQPHYSVVFYKMGEQGKYSDHVQKLLGGYNQLEHSDFIVIVKEYNDIELYINWERLGIINFNYDIENHFKFYKNLFSQAAFHEYAHTYLITTTSTMLYPSEVIDYLNTIGIRSVWSEPIPPRYQKEFDKIYYNSTQTLRVQKLKNKNNSFLDIAAGVCECHANYTALHKLNDKLPTEFLEFSIAGSINWLRNYSKSDIDSISDSNLNRIILKWIVKAGTLFVYDKWNLLDRSIEKYGFKNLSKFARELNKKFLEIAKNYDNIKPIKEEILKLAEKTDKVNFRTIMEKKK